MADHYADGTYRWWHLSRPSPELVSALGDGWLPSRGRALDIGCGLGTEIGYLAATGWQAAGIDLSETAIAGAAAGHDNAAFARADVRLFFRSASTALTPPSTGAASTTSGRVTARRTPVSSCEFCGQAESCY